jgi:hypothetical protein
VERSMSHRRFALMVLLFHVAVVHVLKVFGACCCCCCC